MLYVSLLNKGASKQAENIIETLRIQRFQQVTLLYDISIEEGLTNV